MKSKILGKIIRWLLVAITLLFAYLIVDFIEKFLLDQTRILGAYEATAIGMLVIIIIFIPLFHFLEVISEKIIEILSGTSSRIFGKLGIYIFLAACLIVLYGVYLKIWFNVKLWRVLF
jgi:hypothetical protein